MSTMPPDMVASRLRHLAPYIAIVLGLLLLAAGTSTVGLGCILGGHLVAPVWAARAPREERTRALLLGPVLLVAIELVAIVVVWLWLAGGNPEDTWLSFYLLIIAMIAVAVYIVYCFIAYTIVVRRQR